MKTIALLIFCAVLVAAQTPEPPAQWAGGGLLYDNGVGTNGLAAYAHRLTANALPTYSFTLIRITGMEGNPFVRGAVPFKLLTAQETGIAQYAGSFGAARLYAFGTFGASQTSNEGGLVVGNSVSTGGFASIHLGRGWTLNPFAGFSKASLADGRWYAGILAGWGK